MNEMIPASEWKRRRLRMDLSIFGCWALTLAAFVYGWIGGENPIIQNFWPLTLAGALGLVVNYHWAATKDDSNRMTAMKDLLVGVKQ